MDFKSLLNSLDQLSEATEKTKTGVKHTSEPGGYGRKDDEDEKGKKVKSVAPAKSRGRPKKEADTEGEVKKYDFSAFGVKTGKDVKLSKHDKTKTTLVKGKSQGHTDNKKDDGTGDEEPNTKKKSLKEYLDQLDKALNEEGITIKPMQGASQIIGPDGKPMGTADMATANLIKTASEKGTLKLSSGEQMEEGDIGKHNNATTGFDALVRKLTPKYGVEAAKRIAGAQMKKIKEADMPPNDSLLSPMSEARAKADKKKCPPMSHIKKMCKDGKTVAEICKMHPDCDKKELKQMIADCKKKMIKEGGDHRLKAARHMGKAHALTKEGYNCKYEDMEESRHYHEGYKEGLDECYNQMPIQGYVGEQDMMYQEQQDELAEMDKTAYMQQQARSTPGDTFKAFGQTFKDTEVLESPFAFEAWDKELNALLESKEEVAEGVTISSSTGQQGMPDSVSISATDTDANKVLSFIKQLGVGAFSNQTASSYGSPEAQNGSSSHSGIDVMGDHDGMMSLMKKVGDYAGQGQDYESEEDHQHEEKSCNECGGMMEAGHSCSSKEMVDEVETEDQMEYEVAEAEEVVNNNDEAEEEQSDAERDSALAIAMNEEEDELEESYANSADDDFMTDSEFMTDTISGGLNKKKSTGQTTVPVIAGQTDRMGYNVSESLLDWKMLAGIK